jgi:predicted ATPase with chaperone activity
MSACEHSRVIGLPGKSMLAARLPGLPPPLDPAAALGIR